MITQVELDDMLKIAATDEGMHELLSKAKEYYLLKRTGEPPARRTSADILAALRARSDRLKF